MLKSSPSSVEAVPPGEKTILRRFLTLGEDKISSVASLQGAEWRNMDLGDLATFLGLNIGALESDTLGLLGPSSD